MRMLRYRSILLVALILVIGIALGVAARSSDNLAYAAGVFVAVLFVSALVVVPALVVLWLVVWLVRLIRGRRQPPNKDIASTD